MDVKQITPFLSAIDSLSHAKHFSFMTRIRDRAKDKVVTPLGEGLPANLKSAYQTLNMAVVNEDSAYKSQRGSDLTALIKEADDVRDNTLSGIKSMLDALSRIGTDEQKAAVVKVQRQMDVYKLKSTDSYEEEGIKIQQFCADCDMDVQLEQALTALGLAGQVRTLGEQNEQCRRLVNQRNEQRSFTDNQAMQKARKVTDAAYADFVMMLNAYNAASARRRGSTSRPSRLSTPTLTTTSSGCCARAALRTRAARTKNPRPTGATRLRRRTAARGRSRPSRLSRRSKLQTSHHK